MGLEDLHALRKLYGLLQNDGDGLRDERSDNLDEKSRLLLKNLLDGAAERVFDAHSETIAAHLGASYTPCYDTPKQLPPGLINASEISSSVVQSTRKDLNSQRATSSKDEGMPSNPTTRVVASEQSKLSISGSKPENRNKRCRVCQRSTVKQLRLTEETKHSEENSQYPNKDFSLQHQLHNLSLHFHGGKEQGEDRKEFNNKVMKSARSFEQRRQKRICEIQPNPSANGPSVCSSNNAATGVDLISKQASYAIEQIESRISALCELTTNSIPRTESVSPKMPTKKGLVTPSEAGKFAVGRKNLQRRLESNFVQGLRVPLDRNKMNNMAVPLPATVASQIRKENFDQNRMAQKETMKVGTSQSQPLVPLVGSKDFTGPNRKLVAVDAGHKLSRTPIRATTRRGKGLPGHKPSQHTMSPTLYESVGASSSSHSSSNWTSQQASTSCSDSEEHILSGRTPSQRYMGPTTGSESEVYSLPRRRTRGHHLVPTSSSESEIYPVRPSRMTRAHQVGSTSSSESGGYLPSDQASSVGTSYWSVGSTSRRMGYTKDYRSTNSKKQTGRLRKLKDKLAIIFHHHHHHHHHHHGGDDDHQVKMSRGTSLWKNAGRIFNQRSKDGAYGGQGLTGKIKNPVVARNRNQRGHLHALVDGLLKPIQHSNKSKDVGIGNGQHVSKKVVKKLHWWQMLRRQGGVKMPNKPRVKLGYGGKKAKLKALPKMITKDEMSLRSNCI